MRSIARTSPTSRASGAIHLKSATAFKYSGETQPLVHDGIAYLSTGASDVFALDVESGKTIWKYEGNLDDEINTVCCGWTSRGVAIGDGHVYLGKLDGKLVALDADYGQGGLVRQPSGTGERARRSRAHPSTTTAWSSPGSPEASSESGAASPPTTRRPASWSGASTRSPAPVRPDTTRGHRTTTRGSTEARLSGRRRRSIPKLGLLYFSTGNTSPDFDGSNRKGDNLFANSIVALDAKTGEYRWHFQQVHHDIWDLDSPSPVVLFDVKVDGQTAARTRGSEQDGLGLHPRQDERQASGRNRREGGSAGAAPAHV